jgi:membrane associated rhomboid family serine protease
MAIFNPNQPIEVRRFRYSLVLALVLVLPMFGIKLIEVVEHLSFARWGIYPRTIMGLRGIIIAPFIHGDWTHLWSNLTSFMALGTALFYFYKDLSFRVLAIIYLFSGAFVWFIGRETYHIGSSGVVYGLAAFLFFSGIIRQYIPLMAISLIVAFYYGSMVWGIFPLHIDLPYSWEAHLGGTIGGILAAVALRNSGPKKPVKKWDNDEDLDSPDDDKYWEVTNELPNEKSLRN